MSKRRLRRGQTIAPGYQILDHLSRTNTFDIFDVWSERRRCRCIAKTLRPDRAEDASCRRRLLAEGALLRRLAHPNIVRGYETIDGSPPVVVMETLTGETLAHLIARRRRRLSVAGLGQLGLQLCSAVGYLHHHRLLHLDLKPTNVIAEGGRVKLIDFSLARRPGRGSPGVGTWCYLAPEQATGGRLTAAADVWGLGMVLYETAAGRPVFASDEPLEYPQLLTRIRPITRSRRLPNSLARAIDACLEPDAACRPSIDEVTTILERTPAVTDPRALRSQRR